MDEQDHGYALTGDALSQAAIAAANRSHMPYSKSPSGVALECKDGRIFSGSYAENAAFNPTLPPLQGALILLNLKVMITRISSARFWQKKPMRR
ncbi:cytidine deaminase [Escherichia coli]|uniref:Cytidine deaminase n=1 Tax=Escherichia coli TaxID=562 RepID=A0A377DPZ4_ECOLX|nr:cytidine deaminase [Escherichia coli]